MKQISFVVLIILSFINVAAQNKTILKNDAEIIEESNVINIVGDKLDFINYNFTIKRKILVKSEKGIQQVSNFKIPENFDPTLISHFPINRNYQHAYSNIEINDLKVLRSNTSGISEVNTEVNKNDIRMVREDNRFGTYQTFDISFNDANVGDTIILNFSYTVKFYENLTSLLSMRIFMNSNIFKKKSKFSIMRSKNLVAVFSFNNGADPDTILKTEKTVEHQWCFENLLGNIFEPGSRPFMELPNIFVSIEPNDLLYSHEQSLVAEIPPTWSVIVKHRESEHGSIFAAIDQGVTAKKYRLVKKFVDDQIKDIENDSLGIEALKKIHHAVADNFSFENDLAYFENTDVRDSRFGEYTAAQKLRDISRYDTYVALLRSAKLPYFTAYLMDNRSGVIDYNFFGPLFKSDYLFAAITRDDKIHYVYPKKSDFGYYLNELPFYYSNTYAYLIGLHNYISPEHEISTELPSTFTPKSSLKSNQRMNNVMVDVDLNENKLEFKAQVKLKGQYSTLCRGSYLFKYVDETVHPLYGRKIWEIDSTVVRKNVTSTVKKKEFPFDTQISATYTLKNAIIEKADTISMSLTNWVNHITTKGINAEERTLNYYADFLGQDSYVYFIKFPDNVKLIYEKINTIISNSFGRYELSVNQIQPNAIKVSSSFIIHNNVIGPEKIQDVIDIYEKIEQLSNYKLMLVKN